MRSQGQRFVTLTLRMVNTSGVTIPHYSRTLILNTSLCYPSSHQPEAMKCMVSTNTDLSLARAFVIGKKKIK